MESHEDRSGGDGDGRPRTILVVEDEALLRLSTVQDLRDQGYAVKEAQNGVGALEILRNESVDLVFTDVNMPGEPDGFGLLEWIAQQRPTLPVIVTSGDAANIHATRDAPACVSVFSKPYDTARVGECIGRVLGRGRFDSSDAA